MARPDEDRIARNEGLFRLLNEGHELDALHAEGPAPDLLTFTCECGVLGCREDLRLTRSEYEGVRRRARHFVVVPGHEIPEVEDVVERADRFAVVRKHDRTAPVVEATDPRRHER